MDQIKAIVFACLHFAGCILELVHAVARLASIKGGNGVIQMLCAELFEGVAIEFLWTFGYNRDIIVIGNVWHLRDVHIQIVDVHKTSATQSATFDVTCLGQRRAHGASL